MSTLEQSGKILKDDLENFKNQFNDAEKPEADKYKGTYAVVLVMKDGGKRTFLVNGNKIQESGNWMTWHFKKDGFVAALWKRAK